MGLAALGRWPVEFVELMLRIGGRFARPEPRGRVAAFLRGMLAGLSRTNCWSIAEHAGELHPRGMQWLLSQAVWDEEGVQQDLRGYVTEHLGGPGAVLVVHETGDVQKGRSTVGARRQYTGTTGRIENALVEATLDTADVPRRTGLLVRRSITTGECAFYRVNGPRPVPLAELVRIAGAGWKVEESFAGWRGADPRWDLQGRPAPGIEKQAVLTPGRLR